MPVGRDTWRSRGWISKFRWGLQPHGHPMFLTYLYCRLLVINTTLPPWLVLSTNVLKFRAGIVNRRLLSWLLNPSFIDQHRWCAGVMPNVQPDGEIKFPIPLCWMRGAEDASVGRGMVLPIWLTTRILNMLCICCTWNSVLQMIIEYCIMQNRYVVIQHVNHGNRQMESHGFRIRQSKVITHRQGISVIHLH